MSKQIDFDNLTYYFKGPNFALINFIGFRGPKHVYDNLKNGNTSISK